MLMMHPLPHAFSPWKAALLIVKVPSVSMSKTALTEKEMSKIALTEKEMSKTALKEKKRKKFTLCSL